MIIEYQLISKKKKFESLFTSSPTCEEPKEHRGLSKSAQLIVCKFFHKIAFRTDQTLGRPCPALNLDQKMFKNLDSVGSKGTDLDRNQINLS